MDEQRPQRGSIAILRDWWERQRGARAMPHRAEIDPAALRQALQDLIIIDVAAAAGTPGPHVFTYRLAGTRVEDRFGFYLTGRTVEQAHLGDATPLVQAQYETAVAECRPIQCRHRVVAGGTRYVEYERLAVPLAGADGRTVVALLAAVDFICAYDLISGMPHDCPGPACCERREHCIQPGHLGNRTKAEKTVGI